MKVCVFCGSSEKVDPQYFQLAYQIGKALANQQHEIIYGGGKIGLMGALYRGVREAKGKITGIVPRYFRALIPEDIPSVHFTEGLHDRKSLMLTLSDAFLVLPGGLGTLDELLEVLALKSLHKTTAPIIIFDMDQFYAPLFQLFEQLIQQHFMEESHRELWFRTTSIPQILEYLNQYRPTFLFDDLWPDRGNIV